MCFGSSKPPDVPAPPPPAPVPTPSEPTDVASQTAQQRSAVAAQAKLGLLSTIKNTGGAAGIAGTGADLVSAQAGAGQKKTLGGA